MIDVEQLVSPVSPEEPCGVDLSYDPAVQELEVLLQGKPETQFSPAEEPDWGDLRGRCIELLRRTKNLRVAVILCVTLLQTEGALGFREGLQFVLRLLRAYWADLYPRLDPDDNNDPTERVNILASLTTPLGTFDDPMQCIRRLRQTKLSNSVRLGRFSFDDLAGVNGEGPPPQVAASFRDTDPQQLEVLGKAIDDSIASVDETDAFLTKTIGAGAAPDWTPLHSVLRDIRKALAPYLTQSAAAPLEIVDALDNFTGGNLAIPSVPVSSAVPGSIQSRDDVLRTIDKLCEYYIRVEPSSPVPLLLRRAQRLVTKNFLEIIGDLSPEALGPLYHVTGTTPASTSEAS